MSLTLPPFQHRSFPPYTVTLDFPDGGAWATACESLVDAIGAWFHVGLLLDDPEGATYRVVRDARGVEILGFDKAGTTVPWVITEEVINLMAAVVPNLAADLEKMEMQTRMLYVLHGKETS